MPDPCDALRTSIARLTRILVGDSTLEETLRQVTGLANEAICGSDLASAVMVVNGRPRTVAFTDIAAATIDDVQCQTGTGPLQDALDCQQAQRSESTVDDERWPLFAVATAAHGVSSSLSLPLVAGHVSIGTINCYSRRPAAFSADTERIGSEFAAVAAVAVANAQAYWDARLLSERLGLAIQSRATIEQAKGILIAEQHCDADHAFELLVRASQRENRKLRDVADQIVKRSSRPRVMTAPGPVRSHGFAPGAIKEKQMDHPPVCDEDKVLELRVQGKSFARIAKTLGLGRPSQANDAFNRAMRRRPPAERDALRGQELIRLDALANGVRAHPERGPDGVARRLRSVARLRAMLMAD